MAHTSHDVDEERIRSHAIEQWIDLEIDHVARTFVKRLHYVLQCFFLHAQSQVYGGDAVRRDKVFLRSLDRESARVLC